MAGDLLVHMLSGMQFVLGTSEIPKRVSAFGGIYRWKDVHGRFFLRKDRLSRSGMTLHQFCFRYRCVQECIWRGILPLPVRFTC